MLKIQYSRIIQVLIYSLLVRSSNNIDEKQINEKIALPYVKAPNTSMVLPFTTRALHLDETRSFYDYVINTDYLFFQQIIENIQSTSDESLLSLKRKLTIYTAAQLEQTTDLTNKSEEVFNNNFELFKKVQPANTINTNKSTIEQHFNTLNMLKKAYQNKAPSFLVQLKTNIAQEFKTVFISESNISNEITDKIALLFGNIDNIFVQFTATKYNFNAIKPLVDNIFTSIQQCYVELMKCSCKNFLSVSTEYKDVFNHLIQDLEVLTELVNLLNTIAFVFAGKNKNKDNIQMSYFDIRDAEGAIYRTLIKKAATEKDKNLEDFLTYLNTQSTTLSKNLIPRKTRNVSIDHILKTFNIALFNAILSPKTDNCLSNFKNLLKKLVNDKISKTDTSLLLKDITNTLEINSVLPYYWAFPRVINETNTFVNEHLIVLLDKPVSTTELTKADEIGTKTEDSKYLLRHEVPEIIFTNHTKLDTPILRRTLTYLTEHGFFIDTVMETYLKENADKTAEEQEAFKTDVTNALDQLKRSIEYYKRNIRVESKLDMPFFLHLVYRIHQNVEVFGELANFQKVFKICNKVFDLINSKVENKTFLNTENLNNFVKDADYTFSKTLKNSNKTNFTNFRTEFNTAISDLYCSLLGKTSSININNTKTKDIYAYKNLITDLATFSSAMALTINFLLLPYQKFDIPVFELENEINVSNELVEQAKKLTGATLDSLLFCSKQEFLKKEKSIFFSNKPTSLASVINTFSQRVLSSTYDCKINFTSDYINRVISNRIDVALAMNRCNSLDIHPYHIRMAAIEEIDNEKKYNPAQAAGEQTDQTNSNTKMIAQKLAIYTHKNDFYSILSEIGFNKAYKDTINQMVNKFKQTDPEAQCDLLEVNIQKITSTISNNTTKLTECMAFYNKKTALLDTEIDKLDVSTISTEKINVETFIYLSHFYKKVNDKSSQNFAASQKAEDVADEQSKYKLQVAHLYDKITRMKVVSSITYVGKCSEDVITTCKDEADKVKIKEAFEWLYTQKQNTQKELEELVKETGGMDKYEKYALNIFEEPEVEQKDVPPSPPSKGRVGSTPLSETPLIDLTKLTEPQKKIHFTKQILEYLDKFKTSMTLLKLSEANKKFIECSIALKRFIISDNRNCVPFFQCSAIFFAVCAIGLAILYINSMLKAKDTAMTQAKE